MATKGARYCCALNCSSNSKTSTDPRTGQRVQFHRFPMRDRERCLKWMSSIHREDLTLQNIKTKAVCSCHFETFAYNCPSDIATSRLLPGALPTIAQSPNPPISLQSTRKPPSRTTTRDCPGTNGSKTHELCESKQRAAKVGNNCSSTKCYNECNFKADRNSPEQKPQVYIDNAETHHHGNRRENEKMERIVSTCLEYKTPIDHHNEELEDIKDIKDNPIFDQDFKTIADLKTEVEHEMVTDVKIEDEIISDVKIEEVEDICHFQEQKDVLAGTHQQHSSFHNDHGVEHLGFPGDRDVQIKSGLVNTNSQLDQTEGIIKENILQTGPVSHNDQAMEDETPVWHRYDSSHKDSHGEYAAESTVICSLQDQVVFSKRTQWERVLYFKCNACGAGFSSCNKLQKHSWIHTGEKPYKCKLCGIIFVTKSSLVAHKKGHMVGKPYICDVCGSGFSIKRSLNSHRAIHRGEKT